MSAPAAKQGAEEEAERLLAAAKLNPNDGGAFRSLGHHYARAGDAQRAARCYQRAVTLDPDDAEAGEALCDLLDAEGKVSLELAVCKEAAGKSPRAFWAFQRLGYLQIHQKKWSDAIQSLQHSIRGYPTCADLWEALGLAYHRLGMFTAAVKSYGRAIELDSSRVFALIESGNIQLMLGYFRKGVDQFRSALEMAPRNHSAYFGLASALLAWSKHCVTTGAFTWAANLLKEASETAKVCTSLAGNLSCVWKLHADTQIALARCFPWENRHIKRGMDEQSFKASVLEWKNTCLSAANGAKLSYQRALHLTPWEANIHIDTAICLDLISTMKDNDSVDPIDWELPEKMSLGGLILEPVNKDFWVTLGSVSSNQALKQHSLIRALHLDMSLSEAWAYLGKIYRQSGHKQLARQAFDRARSIDPSLALPWAGMSAENDHQSGAGAVNESYESCLRAVQILPLPEFQIGLGAIAARSGELLSPQVLMAVRQAVQRAPHYPESHNINGLVSEVRSDFQSAITSYQYAKFALDMMRSSKLDNRYPFVDVSVNLARSLCKAGLATDAVRECEELKTKGLLNIDGLQIYALALWKLGRHDEALSISRNLAENLSNMKQESAAGALGFICTLAYNIAGKDSAALVIHTLPGQPSYNRELKFIISALDALQPSKRFQLPHLSTPPRLKSYEVMSEVHSNIALGKAIGGELNNCLGVEGGLSYLKKVLHMYPDCSLVRNHLGSLLLSSGDWTASHKAVRVTSLSYGQTSSRGLRSPHQIQACATMSCYATCTSYPKFSFPTCEDQYLSQHNAICNLQRLVHQEPWNQDARYLLVLAIFQKAREEKYPKHICTTLKRLVLQVMSSSSDSEEHKIILYKKYLLLLLSSEVSLQSDDYENGIAQVTDALRVAPPSADTFFAHLQLVRAYVVQGDLSNSRKQYMKCLQNHTNTEIGWVMLKQLEYLCSANRGSDEIEINLKECVERNRSNPSKWAALFSLACAQCYMRDEDFASAEKALAQACAEKDADGCILFLNGAMHMEIARRYAAPQFISRAASSLRKAQQKSQATVPIVSLLLAQAEGSLGSKAKWEKNLRLEWFSWPPELRPAELYFQMHLLANQSSAAAAAPQQKLVETMQSPGAWLLRAIHQNPSCSSKMAQPDDSDEAPDQATYIVAPSRPPLPIPPAPMSSQKLSMNTIPSRMSSTTSNNQDEAPDQATYMAAPLLQPPVPTPPPLMQSSRNPIPPRMSTIPRNDQDLQDENIVPKVGMSFQSEEEAYEFYNFYARTKGFSIRKCHLKYRADGSLSSKYLVCSKSGVKATHSTHVVKKEQAILRTDCMARVQFSISREGIWGVQKVMLDHNHQFVSPDKRHMLRSQRQLLDADRHMIKQMRTSGIKQSEIYDFCELWYGKDAVPFLQMDCNNYLRSERSKYLETKDAQTLMEHLKNKQAEDPSFFYAMQLNDVDGTIMNIFWTDGQAIMDYSIFGDALSFDTTFSTNKFQMPFAPFIGVNHHKQTVQN